MRRHLQSPAMVVSLVALVAALGGTSYAALKLPRNSVGTAQIRPNAVTSAKVKNHSLMSSDFKTGQLPAGPAGPAGPTGPQGRTGPAGPAGPAGSALAYGFIGTDATVKRSAGVASVTHPATGVFCITLSNASVNLAQHSVVVSPGDLSDPGVEIDFAGGSNTCGTHALEVHTYMGTVDTTSSDANQPIDETATDEPFYFLVG